MAWTSIATFGAKGITLITTLVSVRLTLRYLGPERYGMWMTISSVILALSFADLGLGNGLVNAVSEANGRDDRRAAREAVSSTFLILAAIALVIVCVFGIVYRMVAWPRVFNVQSELAMAEAGSAVLVFVLCFAASLPLGVVQRIQMGFQEGFASNLWQSAGNVIGLAAVIVAIHLKLGLPYLVLGMSGGPAVAAALNGVVQFGWTRPWLTPSAGACSWGTGRKLMGAGALFTVLSVMSILGTQSDSLVISHYLGAAAVAPYAVAQRLLWMCSIAPILTTPLWPAFGEAVARGDSAWASRTLRRFSLISLGTGLVTGIPLVVFGRAVIGIWVGKSVQPAMALLAGLAVWGLVGAYAGTLTTFLNNKATLSKQVWLFSAASLVALGLKFPCVLLWQQSGVVWATTIAYGVLYALPAAALASRALRRLQARESASPAESVYAAD